MEDLINERTIDLRAFLNNTHHTGNYYITAPNVFSMEGLTLINEINSIFAIYTTQIKRKRNLKLFLGFRFISIKMVIPVYYMFARCTYLYT